MPKVFVQHESESEMRLAHSHVSGWIFAAVGLAMAYGALTYVDTGVGRWLFAGMGIVLALIGIGGGLWRNELTLDLLSRSYRGRRGFWPSPRPLQGSLDELNGVVLTRQWRRSDDSEHATWVVSLDFRGWQEPLSVFETTSERKGYKKLESLARRLHTPAVDRTAGDEVRRAWEELDRPFEDRARSGTPTDPPPGSAIAWTRTDIGAAMIILPSSGFNIGALFLALFGLPFLTFGAIALLAVSGIIDVKFEGSEASAWIVGSVFVAVGTLLCLGTLFGSVAREVIREDGDSLVVTLMAFGHHYRTRRLPRREIEEIAIKPSKNATAHRRASATKPATEVVLRTDRHVVRTGGELSPEEQAWLLDTLRHLAGR